MNKPTSRRSFLCALGSGAAVLALQDSMLGEGRQETARSVEPLDLSAARFYPMPLPAEGSVDRVTRVRLKQSLALGRQNLLAILDPEWAYLPIWSSQLLRDGNVRIEKGWPSHNLGRWWDAMVRLESGLGFSVPQEAETAMRENLYRFFDNPDHLCLAPFDMEIVQPMFDAHSLREGLLGLNALAQWRGDHRAAAEGRRMCESLLRLTRDDGTWDLAQCDYVCRCRLESPEKEWAFAQGYPANHGRFIEALVWFYETTGEPLALKAAERFARFHLEHTTEPDGSLVKQAGGHTHSYLGTLRGLLLYGELTHQREYIDTIVATYRKTVRAMVKPSGFISHDMGSDTRGETTSPGDVAQLALWLAARHNYVEFFDDVERIVRARLMPCQILDLPKLIQRDLAPLLIGAYGGMYTEAHAGKMATTDITAAVIHTLVDVYEHIVQADGRGLRIHFHFDFEDNRVQIVSKRAAKAQVTILAKSPQNVWIRIPRWAPRESVRLEVGGKTFAVSMYGDYALVPKSDSPTKIVLTHALPVRTEVERTNGVDYSITWRGDEIVSIRPNSDFLPFYPDFVS